MSLYAPSLAILMQTKLKELVDDEEAVELWSNLFTALAEAIVAHIEDNAEIVDSTNNPTGDTIR